MKRQYLSKTGKQRFILLLVNILFFGGYLLYCFTETRGELGLGYSSVYLLFLFPIYGLFYGGFTYQATKRLLYPNGILFVSSCVSIIIGDIETSLFNAPLGAGIIYSAIVTILSLISGIITMLVKKANEKLRRKMDGQTSAEDAERSEEA